MKIYEIIKEETSFDEGALSKGLAGAGLATAVALGGFGYDKAKYPDPPKAQIPKKQLTHLEVLKQVAKKAGIVGNELTQLISQASHETLNFSKMAEMGDNKYLMHKYDIVYRPKKATSLGNLLPGDGVKYKGRGFLQITGRYNYRMAGKALGLPLESHPEILEKPDVAAKAAVWYWTTRVKSNVTNFNDTHGVTNQINPGATPHSLASRKKHFSKHKKDAETALTVPHK